MTYHIVSILNGNVYLNRYTPAGLVFQLASGDTDKTVIYDSRSAPEDSIFKF